MAENRTVLVAGGGIAGPVVAMALRRAGWDPMVFDAYQKPADEVGSFLTVASNGIVALDRLGLAEAVTEAGVSSPQLTLWSETGRRRASRSLADGAW